MKTDSFILERNRWVPNNARLPVLFYAGAVPVTGRQETASALERLFGQNGWPAQWRDSVYTYHHYHSSAHEVLGFAAGHARLMLGGPTGRELAVNAGDVVLLPAGVGHRRIEASGDFLVVGAYPEGQEFDLCREAPTPQMLRTIGSLTFPRSDPVGGLDGPLLHEWCG